MIISISPTGKNREGYHGVSIHTETDDLTAGQLAELLLTAGIALGFDPSGFYEATETICRQKTKLLSEPPSEL